MSCAAPVVTFSAEHQLLATRAVAIASRDR